MVDYYRIVICTAFGCKRPKDAIYGALDLCMRAAEQVSILLDALIVCELVK